ncbi:hypothetical protein ACS5PN_13070 [Roseateles sp. NT4]|uniref:hypothetical protein n=1 Tax=Roseateles sp. NT4 TaxID=3453715 RepID=UPI003EEC0B89
MKAAAVAAFACSAGLAAAATPPADLAANAAALTELVNAVSLDVMSEAALEACDDIGAASTPQMRSAWVAWRDKHQIAPLRMVVMELKRRQGSSVPPWTTITEPMRQRVLADPAPDKVCAGLINDWQGAGMDASAQFPQARAAAMTLVRAKMVSAPEMPALAPGAVRGQVFLPSQMAALAAQQKHTWSAISDEEAQRTLGFVYIKGRVERWGADGDRFQLVQEQGERRARLSVTLGIDAEPWVGREVVMRGLVTSLSAGYVKLSAAAVVGDPSGLTPSPLPQAALERKEVLLQRVLKAPGQGLPDKELAAVVIHGESNFNNGTHWDEDVRFLLRDGTAYRRTEMPPDQLNVAASRQLEPQRWGRWRASGRSYEMQAQDDNGRPKDDWKAEKHYAVKPWPQGARLEGSFSRGSFSGSLALGGTSATRSFRFTRDGRFERSYSSFSGSGTLAATMNNVNIAASSHGDGKGSSSSGGGTVGGPFGTAGAVSSRKQDDGASRRGRYQLSGYVLLLDYDDGHQERLLSFPVHDDNKTVYVGNGSLSLDK